MKEQGGREVVERYAKAVAADDYEAQDALLADDLVEDYPQSGERITGKANRRAILENYPGKGDRRLGQTLGRIVGTGDEYTATVRATYPNGELWHIVQLIELRRGKIARLTTYFAQEFEPPEWRARWVERRPREDTARS